MTTKSCKVLYTMGEVTEMFDVSPTLIRFWEKKFDIIKPQRNKKGNRLFTQADVDNLRLIYQLSKEQGMKLDAVKRRLRHNPDEVRGRAEVLERLYAIRSLLLEVRQELKLGGDVIHDDNMPETDLIAKEERVIEAEPAAKESAAKKENPPPRIIEQTLF